MTHVCNKCGRRLPVSNVVGQVQAWCRHCKAPTLIFVPALSSMVAREQC